MALCANAARTAGGALDVEPIAVSGSFLSAPDPGPLRLVTTMRKRGRRVSVVDVELNQGERAAVRAVVTLAVPEPDAPPLLSVNPVVPLMTPDPPPGLEPIGPGHPMAEFVHLAHGCDIRPSLTTMGPRTDGGPPVIEYWVRPREGSPDVLFALLCGDVSAPVTFGVNRFGWGADGPTRGVPARPARRRVVAGAVHDHTDRPGVVRRGPRRRGLRRPHHRAEPSARIGAAGAMTRPPSARVMHV